MARAIKLGCVALLFSLNACANTVRITTTQGKEYEVNVLRSRQDYLVVSKVSDKGREYSISRDRILNIDHPGNVHMAVGIPLAVTGSALLTSAIVLCAIGSTSMGLKEGDDLYPFFLAALGVPGIAATIPGYWLSIWGGNTWKRSKNSVKYLGNRKSSWLPFTSACFSGNENKVVFGIRGNL